VRPTVPPSTWLGAAWSMTPRGPPLPSPPIPCPTLATWRALRKQFVLGNNVCGLSSSGNAYTYMFTESCTEEAAVPAAIRRQ